MFPKSELPMIQRAVLDHAIEGRLGCIAYDPSSQCIYFAATAAGRVEVLDSKASPASTIQSIKGLNEPNGMAVIADQHKLLLTSGDGSVKIYDIAKDGQLTESKSVVNFPGLRRTPIRYDDKTKKAYFGHGKFVDWIDPAGAKAPKSLEMPGPAKGIAIDPKSSRIFVDIPSKGQIVVVDRDKWEIETTWTLKDATGNYPLTLDEADSKLFVCCRNPAKMLILDMKDGKELDRLTIGEDSADCWWDPIGLRRAST